MKNKSKRDIVRNILAKKDYVYLDTLAKKLYSNSLPNSIAKTRRVVLHLIDLNDLVEFDVRNNRVIVKSYYLE